MKRHATQRRPKRTAAFSWGRVVSDDGTITYRLFRRDQLGKLHAYMRTFSPIEQAQLGQAHIVREIVRARRELREQVDDIDLKIMGVIEA